MGPIELTLVIGGLAIIALASIMQSNRISQLKGLVAARDGELEGQGNKRQWLENRLHSLESDNMRLQGNVDEAWSTIIDLKREGFELPSAPPPQPAGDPHEKIPTVIMDTINQRAQRGDPLYNQLLGEALDGLREPDADPEKVAKSIAAGSNYNPYD